MTLPQTYVGVDIAKGWIDVFYASSSKHEHIVISKQSLAKFVRYQFGTNWAVFSDKAGPIIGPLMGYEVLRAFFLEAGFLGIMLFGRARVGDRLHAAATIIVAVGTLFSAFWIISVNSWMQTPQGYAINAAGQYIPESWLAIIFNPSFLYRLVHMVLAAYLTTAFVVGGVGAWHLRRSPDSRGAAVMFSMAMWMAVLVAPCKLPPEICMASTRCSTSPPRSPRWRGILTASPMAAPL